jgi:hypothetical protein
MIKILYIHGYHGQPNGGSFQKLSKYAAQADFGGEKVEMHSIDYDENDPYGSLRNIKLYYYGNDIELIRDAPIEESTESAPDVPLRLGSANDAVRTLQIRLNRISANYPSIPKIVQTDGIFGTDTEAAVRRFQEIFSLTPDGVVGKSTWYRIQNVYIGVKRLTDLNSEGITLDEVAVFGDSENDISMLEVVPHSVVVRNASADALAVANYRIGLSADDAVADALADIADAAATGGMPHFMR